MTLIPNRTNDAEGWGWYGKHVSVTTVLGNTVAKPALTNWLKKNSENKINKTTTAAFDYGTRFHKALEDFFLDKTPEVQDDFRPGYDNFIVWAAENNVKPLHIEKTMFSHKYGFAGTADFIGYVNGELMICDWKTSKRYDITYGWQLGALRLACAEELGIVPGLAGVQISKIDHKVKIFKYQHFEAVENAFLNALDTWKMLYFNKLQSIDYPWLFSRAMKRDETIEPLIIGGENAIRES
jgi:hypothetical protein